MESPRPFSLFSSSSKKLKALKTLDSAAAPAPAPKTAAIHRGTDSTTATAASTATFSDLGLPEWSVSSLSSLSIRRPTPVQRHCIPRIIAGDDVLAIAHTGSGKTAAFALPILRRLALNPYGVFALVVTASRELAVQLIEQFRAFGAGMNLRCALVVGGMVSNAQKQALGQRPHVVVATPGRIMDLMKENSDVAAAFSKTKFLVLDEADRILNFEKELMVIFNCLPKDRQTLLFSATKTCDLEALHKISPNSTYFYEEYEGPRTVESLMQRYILIPANVKDVYLHYILSRMEDNNIRSAMVFVSKCESCHFLNLLLEELDQKAVALHSYNSQRLRLSALNKFKSGQAPILIATDLGSRGLDIPTVDLVINYDIPRCAADYVHRVGRTARAGRGGLSISFLTQNDINLLYEIEANTKKHMDAYECNEKEVLEDITKVFKARRVARMKMMDDGFDEKVEARKAQKKRMQMMDDAVGEKSKARKAQKKQNRGA